LDLHELTVSEAGKRIRKREISPVELTRALLAHIATVDASIQAWETVDEAGALAAARRREAELGSGGFVPGLLHGIPFGIKDIYHTAGLRTTAGFPVYADFVPSADAASVSRLRQAGGIILGKTVTTQFAFIDPARTRNPWRLDRTPGGSSSGSGAAVAARMVPGALGTQTAGSLLRPAAFCGVVGFKPSYGRISLTGVFPLSWSLDHAGFIVRTVEDAALLLQALAGLGEHAGTVTSSVDAFWPIAAMRDQLPKLILLLDFLDRATPEVRDHVVRVANTFRNAGALVEERSLPWDLAVALAVHRIIMEVEMAAVHAQTLANHLDAYAPLLRSYVRVGQLVPGHAYIKAQRLRRRLRAATETMMGNGNVLLLPTVSSVAPTLETTGDSSFQSPWSLLGLPSISLPSGRDSDGLPFAIQLVAPFQSDRRLLEVARWCEARLEPLPSPLSDQGDSSR